MLVDQRALPEAEVSYEVAPISAYDREAGAEHRSIDAKAFDAMKHDLAQAFGRRAWIVSGQRRNLVVNRWRRAEQLQALPRPLSSTIAAARSILFRRGLSRLDFDPVAGDEPLVRREPMGRRRTRGGYRVRGIGDRGPEIKGSAHRLHP
jgi:hypothetical protein